MLQGSLAFLPIIVLVVALGVLKWPAALVAPLTLALTIVLAILGWDLAPGRAIGAVLEGIAFGLWPIMLIVLAAMFTHRLAIATGSLARIQDQLARVTSDSRVLVLILAWGFGGFLEAVAGYGTAVAIPAAILIALGFEPVFAATVCLVANTVPTAFGAVGVPVATLATLTHLDPVHLSAVVALQLTPMILLMPFILVAMTGGGVRAVVPVAPIALVAGVAFAIPQFLTAYWLGPELPALVGALCSLAATVAMARWGKGGGIAWSPRGLIDSARAWLAYGLILLFIVLASKLVPAVSEPLGRIRSTLSFVEGGNVLEFKWLAASGILILFAASVAALINGARPAMIGRAFVDTGLAMRTSALVVVSILALARVMDYSGMIATASRLTVWLAGDAYPFLAPVIGALGTFVTGSDTSSNVLFGGLQVSVAAELGTAPDWLAAANTAGATAGKMISPQSIAIAASATALVGEEGRLLRATLPYCLGYVALIGVVVYLGAL